MVSGVCWILFYWCLVVRIWGKWIYWSVECIWGMELMVWFMIRDGVGMIVCIVMGVILGGIIIVLLIYGFEWIGYVII